MSVGGASSEIKHSFSEREIQAYVDFINSKDIFSQPNLTDSNENNGESSSGSPGIKSTEDLFDQIAKGNVLW